MQKRLFFRCSRIAYDEITRLFDFLWPTAAAMWNLRWQVRGYLEIRPNSTVEELKQRFTVGSGILGANLRRACIEQSWEQQQHEFAGFLLVNCFAVYEGWIASVLKAIGAHSVKAAKDLQFPDSPKSGVLATLKLLTSTESQVVKAAFYDTLVKHERYNLAHLQNLLWCYRFYKECRNSIIHSNGIADQKAKDAFDAFSVVASTHDLGVKEVPEHFPVSVGKRVQLSLRGVVGFSDVLRRLIATLDVELSRCKNSERELLEQWNSTYPKLVHLPAANPKKRENSIKKRIDSLRLPKPTSTKELDAFLRSENRIF